MSATAPPEQVVEAPQEQSDEAFLAALEAQPEAGDDQPAQPHQPAPEPGDETPAAEDGQQDADPRERELAALKRERDALRGQVTNAANQERQRALVEAQRLQAERDEARQNAVRLYQEIQQGERKQREREDTWLAQLSPEQQADGRRMVDVERRERELAQRTVLQEQRDRQQAQAAQQQQALAQRVHVTHATQAARDALVEDYAPELARATGVPLEQVKAYVQRPEVIQQAQYAALGGEQAANAFGTHLLTTVQHWGGQLRERAAAATAANRDRAEAAGGGVPDARGGSGPVKQYRDAWDKAFSEFDDAARPRAAAR